MDNEIAEYLLQGQPITAIEAVRIILEGIEALGEHFDGSQALLMLRGCMQRGVRQVLAEKYSLPFGEAVQQALFLSAEDCSPRTTQDFRQCMKRLLDTRKELSLTPLCALNADACARMLHAAFPDSPVQRKKARACLSKLFSLGLRRGWCRENPIALIEVPRVKEKTIEPLRLAEIKRLLATAQLPKHRPCEAALGLMLFAGVRPQEVTRLCWEDVDMEELEIVVPPRHSKTGGGRHIPICPPLHRLLLAHAPMKGGEPICPRNWENRWRALRRDAGFERWQQDILRHTYASYYAKAFRDLPALQLYMGHRDVSLLLTRYVNMKGLKRREAETFWANPLGRRPPAAAIPPRAGRAVPRAWRPCLQRSGRGSNAGPQA